MNTMSLLSWASLLVAAPLAAAQASSASAGAAPKASSAGGAPKASPAAAASTGPDPIDVEDDNVSFWLGWIWVSIVGTFIAYQIVFHLIRYVRTVACLSNDTQRYFAIPSLAFGRFKKYLLDAPLFTTRHHREFKLSSALNVGTLPSRLQAAFLVGYFATNVAFCVIAIDWSGTFKAAAGVLLHRTGVLAVVNMVPLFLMAGRNNPFITFCGISFDTFNLIHRWFGRIVVLEAVAHTAAWIASKVHQSGWSIVAKEIKESQMIMTGTIGVVALVFLLFQSPSIIRHAFYETFLTMHILAAGLAVGAVWIHLKDIQNRQHILYGVVAIWVFERTCRLVLLVMRNFGSGGTKAEVEVLPGEAVKVTIRMARPWAFQPGQHAYIYMPSIGLWTNHPFSLAWSEEEENLSEEKGLAMNRQDILEMKKTSVSMIVRRRTGFTEKLFKIADRSPTGRFTASCLIEGPYGMLSSTSFVIHRFR